MGWWQILFGEATSQNKGQPIPARERLYTNPTYRWSIRYPANWTINSKDHNFIRLHSSGTIVGLCAVLSGPIPFTTVDEYTDFLLAENKHHFRDQRQRYVLLGRRRITLSNSIVGNEVRTEIGAFPSGQSRGIIVCDDRRGFTINCETYSANWAMLEPVFDRIIASFALLPCLDK